MELKDNQIDTLRLMAQLEENLGELYHLYAGKFPEVKDFWQGLAHDEADHATWIKQFYGHVEEGEAFFNEGRFRPQGIESNLKYVKEKYAEAASQDITLLKALSLALDLERSLLENKYFEIFEADSVELKHLLIKLSEETQKHKAKVQALWEMHQPK